MAGRAEGRRGAMMRGCEHCFRFTSYLNVNLFATDHVTSTASHRHRTPSKHYPPHICNHTSHHHHKYIRQSHPCNLLRYVYNSLSVCVCSLIPTNSSVYSPTPANSQEPSSSTAQADSSSSSSLQIHSRDPV